MGVRQDVPPGPVRAAAPGEEAVVAVERIVAIAAAALIAAVTLAAPRSRADVALKPVLECTMIVDAGSGAALHRDGACDRQVSPASTFKIPLALMGYDSGILIDEHTPSWDYKAEFNAVKRDHKTVDPMVWERDSVLWYSREITRLLGRERFAGYVSGFGYGNGDISGNRGKNDGLTHSWLSSSLRISPDEQVAFVRSILDRRLPVSAKAFGMTAAIMPAFEAGGWRVRGKTGTGWLTGKSGSADRKRPLGWFVGWAEKDDRRIVFARLLVNDGRSAVPLGPKVRETFLAALPALMTAVD